jgi:hypothetical protein
MKRVFDYLRKSSIVTASVLMIAAMPLAAQGILPGTISIGGYVAGRGGWNSSITALSRGSFAIAALPDVGIETTYTISASKDALAVLDIGIMNAVARSSSVDPFSGQITNEFIMTANALCLSASAGLRFLKFLNVLPEFGLFLRGSMPVHMVYDASVDVFETNGGAQPNAGKITTYTMPQARLQPFFELGAEIGIITFTLGEGKFSVYGQGSMALSQMVRMVPLTQIPDNFNIVGKDPLAGYRTLNVQPISIALGVRYMLDVGSK